MAYLFYVADLDHDRELSAKELKDFLKNVVDVYCILVANVLDAANDELVATGVHPTAIAIQMNKLGEMQSKAQEEIKGSVKIPSYVDIQVSLQEHDYCLKCSVNSSRPLFIGN